MQLPGMSTDPVRLSVDVTWWPDSDTFSASRRLWTRPHRSSDWVLEDMATTGSPIGLVELADRWSTITGDSLVFFRSLVENAYGPFD